MMSSPVNWGNRFDTCWGLTGVERRQRTAAGANEVPSRYQVAEAPIATFFKGGCKITSKGSALIGRDAAGSIPVYSTNMLEWLSGDSTALVMRNTNSGGSSPSSSSTNSNQPKTYASKTFNG